MIKERTFLKLDLFLTVLIKQLIKKLNISKFEKKMFEDFNYTLQQELIMVNKDIYALGYNYPDMVDEISKRKNPFPVEGEILIKID